MYYYNNQVPPQQGWICPKCGRVNAPWLPCCDCVRSQTTGIGYTFDTSTTARKGTSQTTSAEQTEPQTEEERLEERLKDIMTKALTTPQTDCSWK